jgi:CRP/FNR family transcriptional regulator, cyclic AMP receptor protein
LSRPLDLRRYTQLQPQPLGVEGEQVFLASLSDQDWIRLVNACEHLRFASGDVVMRAGEVDRSLAIVRFGRLGFFASPADQRPARVMQGPTVIGEIGFFDGQPRSGTVRALTDGDLLRLSFGAFEALAAQVPHLGKAILLDAGRILAQRLRYATQPVSQDEQPSDDWEV